MFSCLEDRENVSEGEKKKKKVNFEWSFVPIVVVI